MESVFDVTLAVDEAYDNDLLRYCAENERLKCEVATLKRKLKRYTDFINPGESKNCVYDRLRAQTERWHSEVERLNRAVETQIRLRNEAEGNYYRSLRENRSLEDRIKTLEQQVNAANRAAATHADAHQKYTALLVQHKEAQGENYLLQERLKKLDADSIDNMTAELRRIKPELEQYRHFFGNMYYVLKQVKVA